MKATATRTLLADEVHWVVRAVDPRTARDALMSGLTITAAADALTLDAMSYDAHHQARVPATVGEPGRCVVPSLGFDRVLQGLRARDVELSLDRHELVLRAARVECRFRTMDGAPEPWQRPAADNLVKVDGEELDDACARLLPLSRRNADTFEQDWQDAFHLATRADELEVLTGTRYSLGQTRIGCPRGSPLEVLVPAKILHAAVAGRAGQLGLHHTAGTFYVVDNTGREAGLRTYDLALPKNIPGLLDPRGEHPSWTVSRETWQGALKLAATASDRVRLVFGTDQLEVATIDPSKGDPAGEVSDIVEECEGTDSTELLAALEYLNPCLAALTEADVTVRFPGGGRLNLSDSNTRVVFMTIAGKDNR